MAENTVVVQGNEPDVVQVSNDLVPYKWRGLFSNEEWLMHDIVVKSTYGFAFIAIVAHTLVYLWKPWLGLI
jgi:light-harvesting complex 1 beta chain